MIQNKLICNKQNSEPKTHKSTNTNVQPLNLHNKNIGNCITYKPMCSRISNDQK